MKNKFLIFLGIFIFMIIPKNVFAITAPTHMCNATVENGFNCSAGVIEQNWFGSNQVYTTTTFTYSYYGSTDFLPYGLSVYWQNANWCPDEGMVLSGSILAGSNLFDQLKLSSNVIITTSNSNKTFNCTTRALNNLEYYFECSVPSGSGSVNLGFTYDTMPVTQSTIQLALKKDMQVSCNPNNASIINNQNQNTQNIINNQNQNAASVISNMTSQIQNIIRDNQTNTQYLINTTQQTNQTLDSINNADIDSSDKQAANTDAYDDYQDAEENLFDKMDEADIDDMDIAIDVNSSTWVWDRITSWLNSHSLLMSFLISMLSIGIIKMALGR